MLVAVSFGVAKNDRRPLMVLELASCRSGAPIRSDRRRLENRRLADSFSREAAEAHGQQICPAGPSARHFDVHHVFEA